MHWSASSAAKCWQPATRLAIPIKGSFNRLRQRQRPALQSVHSPSMAEHVTYGRRPLTSRRKIRPVFAYRVVQLPLVSLAPARLRLRRQWGVVGGRWGGGGEGGGQRLQKPSVDAYPHANCSDSFGVAEHNLSEREV